MWHQDVGVAGGSDEAYEPDAVDGAAAADEDLREPESLRLRDGRTLGYEVSGDPQGRPVFLCHGTPGSRLGPRPKAQMLHVAGVRLISYDRPGYGFSSRRPDRTVADTVQDVLELADHLKVEEFAVVGRSGGGPHALACVALHPERALRAAALVPMAPFDLMGRKAWYDGMGPHNTERYSAAERGREYYTEYVSPKMDEVRADPDLLLPQDPSTLHRSDRRVVQNPAMAARLRASFTEALRASKDGWLDDNLAFVRPWGFDPAAIWRPVLLWHGTEDQFSPMGHSRWLRQRIRGAELQEVQGASHFNSMEVLPKVFPWLTQDLK